MRYLDHVRHKQRCFRNCCLLAIHRIIIFFWVSCFLFLLKFPPQVMRQIQSIKSAFRFLLTVRPGCKKMFKNMSKTSRWACFDVKSRKINLKLRNVFWSQVSAKHEINQIESTRTTRSFPSFKDTFNQLQNVPSYTCYTTHACCSLVLEWLIINKFKYVQQLLLPCASFFCKKCWETLIELNERLQWWKIVRENGFLFPPSYEFF